MGEKNWESLDFDCLVNIIERVGMESLLFDVPFVCKSWHKASINPTCWRHIGYSESDFQLNPDDLCIDIARFVAQYQVRNFSVRGLIRLMVQRGHGKATSVVLPRNIREKDVQYVVEKCPELTSLSLSLGFLRKNSSIPKLIGKLKLLEEFKLQFSTSELGLRKFSEIIVQIKQNCKNFKSLSLIGWLTVEISFAIVNHLPKIKNLSLLYGCLAQEGLEIVLHGCKDIESLELTNCGQTTHGMFMWNKKKLKELKDMTSHIKKTNIDVSFLEDSSDFDEEEIEVPYVRFF